MVQLKESGEMYLETILVLHQERGFVRSIDVCERMGYSKPSVSRAVSLLREGGYLTVGKDGGLNLTEAGLEVAERTYERHTVLSELFVKLGVRTAGCNRGELSCDGSFSLRSGAVFRRKTALQMPF